MLTDEDIMAAVRAGQLDQLAELYRRYRQPLFGFLVNRGNAPDAAEDLLQTTFERVIKYRATYRPGSAFRAWIFQIARNACHDQLRLAGRMPITDGLEPADLPLSTPSAQADWVVQENGRQSQRAFAALSANYREVVDLAWKRNLKYAEIAGVLGISEANVKVRMHRAVKQLRTNYAKLEAQ